MTGHYVHWGSNEPAQGPLSDEEREEGDFEATAHAVGLEKEAAWGCPDAESFEIWHRAGRWWVEVWMGASLFLGYECDSRADVVACWSSIGGLLSALTGCAKTQNGALATAGIDLREIMR